VEWCRAKTDPTYKPRRLKGVWFGEEDNVSATGKELWMEILTGVLDKFFLKEDKLEELYHGMSSSLVESLNNVVAALAEKRLFLARSETWRTLVAIAVLNWQMGPVWVKLVLADLGIADAGERTELGIDREAHAKEAQSNIRRSPAYKLYVAKANATRANELWEDDVDCAYVGRGAYVGGSGPLLVNHGLAENNPVSPSFNPDECSPEDDEEDDEVCVANWGAED
jgi:hypothetical protein